MKYERGVILFSADPRRSRAAFAVTDAGMLGCLEGAAGASQWLDKDNKVETGADLPEGGSRADFRDPKIFPLSDGRLCCAIGNRPADDSGQIRKWEQNIWTRATETDGSGIFRMSPEDFQIFHFINVFSKKFSPIKSY